MVQGRRRAVMHDVARRAGVSHQTVSRVINGNPNVRAETRARVEQAMTDLDYRPNALARGLARRRSRTIGVIGFDTTMWGPSSTLIAIQRAAQEAGYGTLVATLSDSDTDETRSSVRFLTDQGVDGVIVVAPSRAAALALGTLPADLPAVAVEADFAAQVPTVAVDQRAGARIVTEHLIALGHRHVAHVAGPPDWHEARQREAGWRTALGAAGLEPGPIVTGDWSAGSGHRAAATVLEHRVTAVFAANDQMALGVLSACAERGVAVPGELSVAGFDDMPGAAFYVPPLTTVRQDFDAVGREGLTALVDAIDGRHGDGASITPELVVRTSTGSAP